MADHDEQPGNGPGPTPAPPPPPPPPPPTSGPMDTGAALASIRSEVASLTSAVASLVDADTERRQAMVRLGALVERTAARMDEIAGASTALRALGPDLEAALVEAGRRLGEQASGIDELRTELAGLGPKVNELLDRRPDWAAVLEPLDARLTAQADARSADRELLERVASQLGGLREVTAAGPSPEAMAEAVRNEVAPLADALAARSGDGRDARSPDELARLSEAVERMGHRLTDGLGSVRDAAMAPALDLQAALLARAERTDGQLADLASQITELTAATERGREQAAATEGTTTRLEQLQGAVEEVAAAVAALTWQLPESGSQVPEPLDPEGLADAVATLLDTRLSDTVAALLDTGLRDAVQAAVSEALPDAAGDATGTEAQVGGGALEPGLTETLVDAVTDAVTRALADLPAFQPPPPPAAPELTVTLVDAVTGAVADALAAPPPPPPPPPPVSDAAPATVDLAPVQQRLDATAADIERAVADRTEAAMAGLLRLLDDRFATLRDDLDRARSSGGSGGFEAGAVLGASQAAWNRLEDRLDGEFDDLGRQLHALGVLVERALDAVEQRQPLVSGEGIRKAAASMRDTVVGASRNRRDRRGGPRGLGRGD